MTDTPCLQDYNAILDVLNQYNEDGKQAAVVRVDIVGTAASARIDTDDISGFRFTDFFSLLKINGRWSVVSKIYHTHAAAC